MSPAEVMGLLLEGLEKNPFIQWVLLLYLSSNILLGLSKLFTNPEQGWRERRVRRLRYLADSVREGSRARGYLEGLAEREAFRKATGLPRSITPNQQELVFRLDDTGEFTATEARYAAEFAKPAGGEKVSVVVGRVDTIAYWWSALGLLALVVAGGTYLLLAALVGSSAATNVLFVLEMAFGVGMTLWQMQPTFVARRLRKKLAVAGLLKEGDPRHWSDPLRFEDGLLVAALAWAKRGGGPRSGNDDRGSRSRSDVGTRQ